MNQELMAIEKMENSEKWFHSMYEKLQREHEGEFVAIEDEKIVATGGNSTDIIKKLKNRKKNLALILIEFIPKKGVKIIL